MMNEALEARSHLVIPDTQVGPGHPTKHLEWIGAYIVERRPSVVVHLGDNWDMASLSGWDKKGSRRMEGRRYKADVRAGNVGIELVRKPARDAGLEGEIEWHLLRGNHENRIALALEDEPKFEGVIGFEDLESPGWLVHDFLVPVELDGVVYSHYFYQPMTGRPYSGTIENRLKTIGHSFTMGHQQTLLYGLRYVAGRSQHGLIAGACYLHDETYKGPQGNAHWRGIIVKHQVEAGSFNPMFVDLEYLCRRYEGMSLARFKHLNGIKSSA